MNLRKRLYTGKQFVKVANKPKIFCIGANKTGTTSLKQAMKDLDFVVGSQARAEELLPEWAERKFQKIIKYCYTAQFFQDIPFSLPYTYVALDQSFSRSKFILTVRDNSNQWYNSITKAHANLWGKDGEVPTDYDLKQANYHYSGGVLKSFKLVFDTPRNDLYNKEELIKFYEQHNREILSYFRHRPNDLLVLNVAQKGAYKELCDFLGVQSERTDFPWKNRTRQL